MRNAVLALALVAAFAGDAAANGRPPGTSTIHFRQGHDSDVVAGMTFGLVVSHDAGATWQWMCETAVGYAGMYDPDYAYSTSGALFATTFNGLVAERDACTFAATTFGTTFMSQVELAPDGTLYSAAADPSDATIYKSTNDGMTFAASAQPGVAGDWWQTIIVAPGNPSDVFLSGYRLVEACDTNSANPFATCDPNAMNLDCGGCSKNTGLCVIPDGGTKGTCDGNSVNPGGVCQTALDCNGCTNLTATCEAQRKALLFESKNGGASFTPLPGNLEFLTQTNDKGLTTTANSNIDFVGTSSDGSTLYARVEQETALGEGLYKIDTTAGTTWTHVLSVNDNIAALVRSNGDLVVGTRASGAQISTNGGTTWTPLTNPPHINCLVENSAHEVWACTQQFGSMSVPGDGFGIMKTTDLASWTGVLRYPDIQQPVSCAAGTPQHDSCQQQLWCGLKLQLAITSTVIDCSTPPDAGMVVKPPPKKTGCCDSGEGGASALLLGGAVATLLARRRRPRME